MRAIEVRGKRKDNGDLVYGHGFLIDKATSGFPVSIYSDKFFKWYKVIPETVDLHTDLLDKNGLKIFGRDIIKDDYGNIGIVFYSEHFCGWRIKFIKGRSDLLIKSGIDIFSWVYPKMMLEVIGNLHDKHKLFKARNQK